MVVMFDSIDVSQIPREPQAVAGYVGGRWPTFGELVRRFPHARRLSIAVNASENADCLDIEAGDATVEQAAEWFHRQHARGVWRPVLYCSLDTVSQLQRALSNAGVQRREVRLWVAHYTGQPHLEAGSDATQWTDRALGRNLDESLCAPDFFPPAPRPSGAPLLRATVTVDPARPWGHWTVAHEPPASS